MEVKLIQLRCPLDNNGVMVKEIAITGIKAKHFKNIPDGAFEKIKNPAAFIPIVANVTGLPESVVDEMDIADLLEVIAAISDFLPGSPQTGGIS